MATVAHVAVGLVAGRIYAQRTRTPAWRAMLAFSVLSIAPDFDVVAFRLGIPYAHPFGHRGASHALASAVGLGLICGWFGQLRGHSLRRVWIFSAVVIGSHGALDALTDGGLGAALWWPFSNERVFWSWRPLPVAPIGRGMLSARGLYVLAVEAAWCAPLIAFALWRRPPPQSSSTGADRML